MVTTSATSSINDIASSTSAASNQLSRKGIGLAETFDNFLLLLTTQLRNQDPTQPLDANQFTEQLVQFTGVEQAVQTNTNLESLIEATKGAQNSNGLFAGSSFIGKQVEAEGNITTLINGNASFSYNLSKEAASSLIKIKDEDGKTVFTTTGETKEGKHLYTWNGRDANGNAQKNGLYKIEVTALDTSNNALPVTTTINGIVTGVESGDGNVQIVVGDAKIPIEHVTAVSPASTTTTTGNTNLYTGTTLIGKYVEALGNGATLEDGNAKFSYYLGREADNTTIRIKDEKGKIIFTASGETSKGEHVFNWDGEDDKGNKYKDGLYTIEIVALDANDNALPVGTTIKGIVEGVISGGGNVQLVIGEAQIPMSYVISVYDQEP